MLACEVGQAAVFFVIAAFLPPLPLLLALVALSSLLATFFLPASRSLLPLLVGKEDLGRANALLATSLNLGLALGPAVGGGLLALFGLRPTLGVNALTFLVSALLLARLPALGVTARQNPEGFTRATLAGVVYVFRQPVTRALAVGSFLAVLFVALDNVALVFLARDAFGSEPAYGLLLSLTGVGMVLGPLLLLGSRMGALSALLWSYLLMGLGTLATGLAPNLPTAAAAQTVMGLGNGVENVALETALQKEADAAVLGRVFGVVYTLPYAALLITYSLGGWLLEATSARTVFVVAGVGVLAGLVTVRLLLPKQLDG